MIVLKTILFIIVVPGSAIIVIPYYLFSSGFEIFSPNLGILRFIGVFPILIGATIAFWCIWDFMFTGLGTPAPMDPPKKLVKKGPYRFVRNPMYLGAALMLIGEILLFESTVLFLYAILVVLVFHLLVTCHEEPALKRKFGDFYKDYFNSVPRWIPQIDFFKTFLKRNDS